MDDQGKEHPTQKGTAPNINRPITCQPKWNILTAQIEEEICYSLIGLGLFPEKQKKCHKGTRATGEELYIDQCILKEIKVRRKI